jgi:RNA polymerase sigma-70 factor (ECF subfamily)
MTKRANEWKSRNVSASNIDTTVVAGVFWQIRSRRGEYLQMTPIEQERHDQFLRLYVEHEEALHGFVRALVPTREDAREVMQEVAAVLWRKFDELHSPQDFRRWAFGVARFEALGFRRDRARDRHVFDQDVLAVLADDAQAMSGRMEAQRDALDECLGKLAKPQQLLVQAAYERDARIDRLAAEMGRTAMSLYKTLHRIRLALIECTQRTLRQRGLA